jgi:hypothetical protein
MHGRLWCESDVWPNVTFQGAAVRYMDACGRLVWRVGMVCAVRDCESSLGSCCWRISSHIPVGMHGRVASLGPTLHTHLSTAPSTAFPPTFWPGERLSQLALLFSVLPFLIISPLRPALSACPGCFLHHLTTTQFACRCLRRRCCCWVEPIAAPQTVASIRTPAGASETSLRSTITPACPRHLSLSSCYL